MSTAIALLRVVVSAARSAGAPIEPLLARARIDRAQLHDPDARIATATYLEIFHAAAAASGQADFGARCGAGLDADAFGLIGFVLGSSPTLGDAFERLSRFSRLLSDELSIVVRSGARQASVRYAMAGAPYVPALFEMAFVHCVATARRGTGDRFRVDQAVFAHVPARGSLERMLDGASIENGRHNELRFSPSMLALPLLGANRTLLGILERQAGVVLDALPVADDFLAGARSAILRELAIGEPTLAVVAGRLGLGARTFQRRLATHEMSYQTLLDRVRRDEALARLQSPNASVTSVARALGYRDASAFHHAFRRWTGESPRQARARSRRTPVS